MHVALHMSVVEEGFGTLAIQIHVRTKEEQETLLSPKKNSRHRHAHTMSQYK